MDPHFCKAFGCSTIVAPGEDFCPNCRHSTRWITPGEEMDASDAIEQMLTSSAEGMKPTNPKDIAAVGRVPLHMVPDTLMLYAAMGFAEGDSKYIAYNFRVGGARIGVYVGALRRHMMKYYNGEWADKKTKIPHLASMASCISILIDGHVQGNIVDDRPPAIDLNEEFARAEEVIKHVYELNKDKRPVGVEYTALSTNTQLPQG